jgi:hypothetical protein
MFRNQLFDTDQIRVTGLVHQMHLPILANVEVVMSKFC